MAANKPYYNYMAVHGMSTTTTTSSTIHNDDGGGDDDDDDNGAAGVNVPLCGQHHQLLTMTMAGRGRKQQQQQPAASLLTTIAPMPPVRNNSIANLFSINRNPQVYSYEHNKLQRNHQGVAAVPGHHSNNSNTLSNAVQNSGVLTTWGSVGADLGRTQILANDDNDEDAAARLAAGVWPPRSYHCTFCRREFRSAQALGGHMNVHRRDRARLRQSSSPPPPNSSIISQPPDALSATTATTTTATPPAPHPPTGTTIFSPDFFFSAKPLPTKYLMPSRASDSTDHNRDLPAKIYSHNHPRRSGTPFNHPPPPPPPTTTTTTTTTTTKSTHDSIDLQILRSHSPRLTKKPFKLDHGLGMDTNYKFEYPGVNPPSKLVDLELRLGHDIVK